MKKINILLLFLFIFLLSSCSKGIELDTEFIMNNELSGSAELLEQLSFFTDELDSFTNERNEFYNNIDSSKSTIEAEDIDLNIEIGKHIYYSPYDEFVLDYVEVLMTIQELTEDSIISEGERIKIFSYEGITTNWNEYIKIFYENNKFEILYEEIIDSNDTIEDSRTVHIMMEYKNESITVLGIYHDYSTEIESYSFLDINQAKEMSYKSLIVNGDSIEFYENFETNSFTLFADMDGQNIVNYYTPEERILYSNIDINFGDSISVTLFKNAFPVLVLFEDSYFDAHSIKFHLSIIDGWDSLLTDPTTLFSQGVNVCQDCYIRNQNPSDLYQFYYYKKEILEPLSTNSFERINEHLTLSNSISNADLQLIIDYYNGTRRLLQTKKTYQELIDEFDVVWNNN